MSEKDTSIKTAGTSTVGGVVVGTTIGGIPGAIVGGLIGGAVGLSLLLFDKRGK